MALDKPYLDVPGTIIFDAEQSRKGYWLNQFCMSLMKADNRERFKANERAYLDEWDMTEEQKKALEPEGYVWERMRPARTGVLSHWCPYATVLKDSTTKRYNHGRVRKGLPMNEHVRCRPNPLFTVVGCRNI